MGERPRRTCSTISLALHKNFASLPVCIIQSVKSPIQETEEGQAQLSVPQLPSSEDPEAGREYTADRE